MAEWSKETMNVLFYGLSLMIDLTRYRAAEDYPTEFGECYGYAFMADSPKEDSWDGRKYRFKPYLGQPGPEFLRFEGDLRAYLWSESDDDNSLEETLDGTDVGGDQYLANGGAAPNPAQTRRHVNRLKKLAYIIYNHVPEPRMRLALGGDGSHQGESAPTCTSK